MKQIEQIIFNFSEEIIEHLDLKKGKSLFHGTSGAALMLAYSGLYFENQKYIDYAKAIMNDAITNFDEDISTSFWGLAGIGWLIQHFYELGIIEKEEITLLDELDDYLFQTLNRDGPNFYDLLNGYLGKGMYFLKRYHHNEDRKGLDRIFKFVEESVITNDAGIAWRYGRTEKSAYQYSLGLCHGVPSILSFLCKLSVLNIEKEKSHHLMRQGVAWLLSEKNTSKEDISAFPDFIPFKDEPGSRLAWCYGDLGIAIALFRIGQVLEDQEIYSEALQIATRTASRKLIHSQVYQDDLNVDLGFCHGLSGIVHLYNRLYQVSGNALFNQCKNYWLKLLLHSQKQNPQLPNVYGFTFRTVDEVISNRAKPTWKESYNILEGCAGMTLVLLSLIDNKTNYWDEFLLTDIK